MSQAHEEPVSSGIIVKVFGGLRERAGRSALRLPFSRGLTVRGVLKELESRLPDLYGPLQEGLDDGYLQILVNGRNIRFLAGYETELAPNDSVAFLPPIGGG
jgi:MoaD family protein